MAKNQAISFFEEISKNKKLAEEVNKVVEGNLSDEAKKGGLKSGLMAMALLTGMGVGGAVLHSVKTSALETAVTTSSVSDEEALSRSDSPYESEAATQMPGGLLSDSAHSSDSVVSNDVTEDNIIDMLHNGPDYGLDELDNIADDNYAELNDFARKLFGNEEITLPENPAIAKDWIKNWNRVVSVFPELRGVVNLVAEGEYSPDGSAASEAMLNTITHFACLKENDITAKTNQVKGYNRKYTIVHELGHVLAQLLLGDDCRGMITAAYNAVEGPKGTLDDEIRKMSPYAAGQTSEDVKFAESFAETLADVVINGKDASELAKTTMKLLVSREPNRTGLEIVMP